MSALQSSHVPKFNLVRRAGFVYACVCVFLLLFFFFISFHKIKIQGVCLYLFL